MSERVVASAAELPTKVLGSRATGWWGILLLVLIESTVFATLITSYFYLKAGVSEWPIGDIDPPKLLLPSINFAVLMASAAPIYMAERGIRRGDHQALIRGYIIALVLGIIFLVLKYIEYSNLSYDWGTNAYASIVWTITGFHSAHVIIVLIKSAAMLVLGWQRYFDEEHHSAIQGNTLYWLFVVGAWVPLFATIYLSPRVM
jgi:heme/copper-type cytochrome/quinol oxidase subunit 3